MNEINSAVQFRQGVKVFEITHLLHSIDLWDRYKVEIGTLMSSKMQIVDMVHEREQVRQAARKISQHQNSVVEETIYRVDIKDLLDHFEEQVKQIEITQSKISLLQVLLVLVTLTLHLQSWNLVPVRDRKSSNSLPYFLGALAVPKGEGSFDQYMFQIRGFRMMHTMM